MLVGHKVFQGLKESAARSEHVSEVRVLNAFILRKQGKHVFIPNSFGIGDQVKQKDDETNQKNDKESFIFSQNMILLNTIGESSHKYNVK